MKLTFHFTFNAQKKKENSIAIDWKGVDPLIFVSKSENGSQGIAKKSIFPLHPRLQLYSNRSARQKHKKMNEDVDVVLDANNVLCRTLITTNEVLS